MRYFKKEVISTPLYLPGGGRVQFEQGGEFGILATDNEKLIEELDKAAKRHVGGLIEISAVQYEELKKKPPVIRSRPNFPDVLRVTNPRPKAVVKDVPAAVKPLEPSEPLSVPDLQPIVTSMRKARARKANVTATLEPVAP